MSDQGSQPPTAHHPALIMFFACWGVAFTLVGGLFGYSTFFVPSRHAPMFDIVLAFLLLPTGLLALLATLALVKHWHRPGLWQALPFLWPLVACTGVVVLFWLIIA